mgnify:CR=1 FL=1
MNIVHRNKFSMWTNLNLTTVIGPRFIDIMQDYTGKRHFNSSYGGQKKTDIEVLTDFLNKVKRV